MTSDVDMPTPVGKILPPLARELAEAMAKAIGACTRPIAVRRIDDTTGEQLVLPLPCGARRASVCKPCATRMARIRRWQALEGWHLREEPTITTREPTAEELALVGYRADLQAAYAKAVQTGDAGSARELEEAIDDAEAMIREQGVRGNFTRGAGKDDKPARRVRSTKRRQDASNLPRRQISSQTIGRIYEAPDGKTFCPSMFLTATLGSYGAVRGDGSPVDPESYDYRRAARDAIHFGALVDRFWQNLRRVAGFDVQYFAAVEPQRRGAPHLHAATRGTIKRAIIRQVIEATYHQVWWPPHDDPVYLEGRLPIWDATREEPCYVDPDTLDPLPTWKEALDAVDTSAEPAHVVRFGHRGVDIQGVNAGTDQANRCIRYLVKYLTKSVAECYEPETPRAERHVARMTETLRYEPCSPTCTNWLRYGVQPKDAKSGQIPGECRGKAHKPENLGYGGRRCLVSKKWSGRNLTEHRHERLDHVLRALGAVGLPATQLTRPEDAGRYRYEPVKPSDPDQPDRTELLLRAIAERRRFTAEYEQAKSQLSAIDQTAA